VRSSDSALTAIEGVYRERYPVFLRVVVGVVGDEEVAREAVHDGFVRAVRHRRRFRRSGSLEAWLWRIVVNEARKRRSRERRLTSVDVSFERLVSDPSRNGGGEDVRALIAALPQRQRLALFLRYYADLDYRAIAEALDVKPGTVAATLNAAHATLRKRLEEVSR